MFEMTTIELEDRSVDGRGRREVGVATPGQQEGSES